MSPKRLLPLVLILLVLGVLAVLFKRERPASQLAEELGLERLVPSTFRADAVQRIELAHGAQPQEVVRLRQRDGHWLVPSRFDAPGNSTKIQQLLTQVAALQGELRADAATLLEDFRLKDEQALHLKLYTDTTDTPALHVLAGKSSGANGFMRRADSTKVYIVNLNLQTMAGLSSTTPEAAPPAKPWIDLRLQNVPKEQITAVELHTPARALRFTTQPPEAGQATMPASWQLASPTLPYSVKSDAVESLVNTLRAVQGDDIVDPANMAAYGLDATAYRATLTVQASAQEPRQVTLSIGADVPDKSGSHYARLDTGGPVYVLPQWVWQRLFPMLGTLLDLHLVQVPEEDVMRVSFQQGGETWEIQRHTAEAPAAGSTTEAAGPWRFSSGGEGAADETAMTSLLGSVTQLQAEDLPQAPPTSTGLESPSLQMTLTLRDGRTASLLVGHAVTPESGGYYARNGAGADVMIIPATLHRTLVDTVAKLKPSQAGAAQDTGKP